jgi:parallel beta-helix repeat protein
MNPRSVIGGVLIAVATLFVPLSVSAQSVVVNPTTLNVSAVPGSSVSSQSVTIGKSGGGALRWSIINIAPWVNLSQTRGTNSGTITVNFGTSNRPTSSGTYPIFTVTAPTSPSVTVSVNLTVLAGAPVAPPTVTCPANMSVTSSDGSPVVVTYTATTSGGVAPVSVTGSPASGSAFPVGTTAVSVTARASDGQTASCSFSVTVTYTAGSSTWTFCATEGGVCGFTGTKDVRYGANGLYAYRTLTDGTPCTNSVFGDPAPGFAKQCATGSTSVAPPPPPPPPPPSSSYGPQATITCPAGAIDIWPGQPIQTNVNQFPGATTFCLRAGVHYLTSSITPKTGNTFVGEYGAILDGSNWSTSDSTQAAFRAHNQDIDYVTIRNLVIRRMPQKGIHAFYWLTPDHWTIEYNEIANAKTGILFPDHSTIRNNYIHHNFDDPSATDPGRRGGGYVGYYASYATFENNEIAYNGKEQKIMESVNVTFRNNFVHHNQADGIWYDGGNPGALIEGNRVEDNVRNGIFYEASNGGLIRNNTVRRSGDTGIFISTSQSNEISGNTAEDNFRAITYFINCGGMVGRDIDLQNNWAHDNTIRVGTQSGAFATGISYTGDCSATQVTTYHNGSKNNRFTHNTYYVPNAGAWYWLWNGMKQWFQWQGIPQDGDGTVQ